MSWDTDRWSDRLAVCTSTTLIGEGCVFTCPEEVFLGSRVRIDPYCVVTCRLEVYGNSHISNHVFLNGSKEQLVELYEWTFLGSGSRVITASDDFTGQYGPVGPWGKNRMDREDVCLEPYSGTAVGVTLLPGVCLGEGVCIAAHSLVTKSLAGQMSPWAVYACPPGAKEPKKLYDRDEEAVRRLSVDPSFLRSAK